MERAAALLRNTDRTVADICLTVGLRSIGLFTTSFGRRFGMSPSAYRAAHPPARVPTCVLLAYARPSPAVFEKTAAKELKSRGVEFQQEPTEQPHGIDAGFRDPSGNQARMAQLR